METIKINLHDSIKWAEDFSCCDCKNYNKSFGVCDINGKCHEAIDQLLECATQEIAKTGQTYSWIHHYDDFDAWGECSNCHGTQTISSNLPYCPWCGSRMIINKNLSDKDFKRSVDLYKKF